MSTEPIDYRDILLSYTIMEAMTTTPAEDKDEVIKHFEDEMAAMTQDECKAEVERIFGPDEDPDILW